MQVSSARSTSKQGYSKDRCVPQLVAAQAAVTPDAVALVMDDRRLSYGELNRWANRLAHYLQASGVGPNVLVGLCIERSIEMVVGLLGILKAGGAYVPLDPSHPGERLTFMLHDADVAVLVTRQSIATHLPLQRLKVVCLDSDAGVLAQESAADPIAAVTAADLAYVIYTSGSTGRPKGVQITHDSLLNLIFWHQQAFTVTACDRATQFASPSFDVTVEELWPYLTIGASVYILDEDTRMVPTLLRDWLVNWGITLTMLPTVLVEDLLSLQWPSTTSLRFLLTGGDRLHRYPPPDLPFALVNNYGPTEATVVTTSGRVCPAEHAATLPPIGRPIANVEVYILDEHLRKVPIGQTGELYIGGVGLARGYLNHSELTAEKFIAHPFSDEPGARLYKTGDLACYLPDGQLAFLGRTDHQIKIRGYRIELGEIEAVLAEHPAVHQAVVVAHEDVAGDRRLVAYVVLHAGQAATRAQLRNQMMKQVPAYMVPSAFVLLEALPLLPNGKIDRKALPAPDSASFQLQESFVAPRTSIEEMMVSIWSQVLGIERVGIHDNFFELGGHSLQALRIIARLNTATQVELPLRTFFEMPTVAQLAEVRTQLQASGMKSSKPPLRPVSRQAYRVPKWLLL